MDIWVMDEWQNHSLDQSGKCSVDRQVKVLNSFKSYHPCCMLAMLPQDIQIERLYQHLLGLKHVDTANKYIIITGQIAVATDSSGIIITNGQCDTNI
ncbi:MAG: hypothetical protein ACEY3J_01390 [Arsenophonus sp.]